MDLKGRKFGRLTCIAKADRPRYWVCSCECGNTKEVRSNHLTMGKIVTCGECSIFTLPGQKIGKLTVIEYVAGSGGKNIHRKFRCRCDCGKETTAFATSLINKRSMSCGNCIDKASRIGKTYGYLRVVSWSHQDDHSNPYWKCVCHCGTETITAGFNLTEDRRPSCGCKIFVEGIRQGEKSPSHILKAEDIKKIRYLWAKELVERQATGESKCTYSIQDLADKYGVSYGAMYKIIHSQTWFFLSPVNSYIKKVRSSKVITKNL